MLRTVPRQALEITTASKMSTLQSTSWQCRQHWSIPLSTTLSTPSSDNTSTGAHNILSYSSYFYTERHSINLRQRLVKCKMKKKQKIHLLYSTLYVMSWTLEQTTFGINYSILFEHDLSSSICFLIFNRLKTN